MSSLSFIRIARRLPRLVRSYASGEESPWYPDNKPGPCPKTEEEKCAAAKKYGMLREEYEPYPDNGEGYGDYPMIKPIPMEDKSQIYPWTDNFYRRNLNDPIPVDFPFYTYGRITESREKHSLLYMLSCFFLAIGAVAAILHLPQIAEYRYRHPVMEKQYPEPGKVHYTFEFANEGSSSKH